MPAPNRVLREFREKLGMTQADFGREADLSGNSIAQMELGKQALGGIIVLRIEDAYEDAMQDAGITVSDLLRGSLD